LARDFRCALITGASSGIGTAFAELLPASTHLILTGRRSERLEAIARRLAAPGRRIETISGDLAGDDARRAVIDAAERAGIDLFISNAGAGVSGDFAAHTLAEERATVDINIVAPVELLHALVPPMAQRARRDGSRAGVIVVASAAAYGSRAGLAVYAASKAFQLRLVEALAEEMQAEPVDILALCPRATDTDFFARARLPAPAPLLSAETVAREGLAMLGRTAVHIAEAGRPPKLLRGMRALWARR
jgi:hypothetical protein